MLPCNGTARPCFSAGSRFPKSLPRGSRCCARQSLPRQRNWCLCVGSSCRICLCRWNWAACRWPKWSLAPELLGQPIRAGVRGRADLAGGAGSANLTLDRLDAVEGRFELDTTFSNETRELSLVLDTTEAPGGIAVSKLGVPGRPSARLRIAGDGPIEDFAADIELATDDTPRVEGRFALQTAQPACATGRVAGPERRSAPLAARGVSSVFRGGKHLAHQCSALR